MNQSDPPATTTAKSPTAELTPVVSALREGLGDDLVALVLFGSRARGDHYPQSDWDLLLIATELPTKAFQRHLYLKKMLPDLWRGRISLLVKTPGEFEAHLPPLLLDVALDGIVLHDTDRYVAQRLAQIKQFIYHLGLYREHHGHDLIWQWRTPPDRNWQLSWESMT